VIGTIKLHTVVYSEKVQYSTIAAWFVKEVNLLYEPKMWEFTFQICGDVWRHAGCRATLALFGAKTELAVLEQMQRADLDLT